MIDFLEAVSSCFDEAVFGLIGVGSLFLSVCATVLFAPLPSGSGMSNTYISGILLGFKTCSSTCVCSVMSDSLRFHSLACQVPLSIEYSRQESWRGLPFPTPRVLPDSRIKPSSLASPEVVGGFFITPPPGKPSTYQLGGCSVLRRSRKTGCCWNEHLLSRGGQSTSTPTC